MLAKATLCAVVGLPDAAIQESRERVRAAIRNSTLTYPFNKRITVNLAPADLRKEGPAYALPIAVGLLLASEQINADLSRTLIIGELSLDGAVRHTSGVLPMAALARERGFDTLFVSASDAPEAALVPNLDVLFLDELPGLMRVPWRCSASPWTTKSIRNNFQWMNPRVIMALSRLVEVWR